MAQNKGTTQQIEICENLLTGMSVFMQHFAPAKSILEADEQQSTLDIAYNLREFLHPKEILIEAINKIMLENDYTLYYFEGGYKWLLKIKAKNLN